MSRVARVLSRASERGDRCGRVSGSTVLLSLERVVQVQKIARRERRSRVRARARRLGARQSRRRKDENHGGQFSERRRRQARFGSGLLVSGPTHHRRAGEHARE